MKLLFIRHTETQTNVDKLIHRTGDAARLTINGQQQAQQLIIVAKNNDVEKLYSSPEQRAQQTADIIAQGLQKDVQVLDGLAERNWGEWSGKPWPEIEAMLQPMLLNERYNFMPPKGESWQEMETRLKQALSYIVSQNYEGVAVITHEGALRGLMPILRNEPRESSFQYYFENGSVNIFEYRNGVFSPSDKLNTPLL